MIDICFVIVCWWMFACCSGCLLIDGWSLFCHCLLMNVRILFWLFVDRWFGVFLLLFVDECLNFVLIVCWSVVEVCSATGCWWMFAFCFDCLLIDDWNLFCYYLLMNVCILFWLFVDRWLEFVLLLLVDECLNFVVTVCW